MKNYNWVALLFLLIPVCCTAAQDGPQFSRHPTPAVIIAAGSGANLEITRLLANAFLIDHPQTTIEIPGSIGSKGAVAAVADGSITLGLLSRPLQEQERTAGLAILPYARVPLVVGVHPSVTDEDITFQDLVDIYRGTKSRWKDGSRIIVKSREAFDSGFQEIEAKVPGFREACEESRQAKRWSVYYTDQEANQTIARTRYSIGITDLGMILSESLNIKVLKLNGIVPSPGNLASGQYPLSRDLLFLYREGTLPEEARAFLDFVRSEAGTRILKANGYLPLQ